jgi:hypothetical protein
VSDAVPKFVRDHAVELALERPETLGPYLDADTPGELAARDAVVLALAGLSMRDGVKFGEQADIVRRMLAKNGWRVVRGERLTEDYVVLHPSDELIEITEEWTP